MPQVKFRFLLLSCVIVMSISCKKDEIKLDSTDYPEFLVFGFSQSCSSPQEDCNEIFKLDPGRVREFSNLEAPTGVSGYTGTFDPDLSSTKYAQILEVFNENKIPQELLEMNSGIIGNAGTFYYYFEYKSKTKYKYFLLSATGGHSIEITKFVNAISSATSIAFSL